MLFLEGHFYRYEGSKRKPYKNLKCVYADNSVAVVQPFYEGMLTPGPNFALPQDCKSYVLDQDFTDRTHQILYYASLRDSYQEDADKMKKEVDRLYSIIHDLNETITKLKGE